MSVEEQVTQTLEELEVETRQTLEEAEVAGHLEDLEVAAANRYVDQNHPSASDSNSGTEDAPWLTIQHAAGVAQPGDRIIVKEGQYDERVVMRNSGTVEAMIIFQASPRRSVLMQGFYINGADHIRVEGFRISNVLTGWSERYGILIEGNYIEIVDNEFFNMNGCKNIIFE